MTLLGATAFAAGPRWTTGSPYFQNNNGNPVVWYTVQPQYFTDPGDLSAYVNHAAADALVAGAAATWNNSMSSIVLAQGGALNEHVSGANVYLGSSGPVFPSDVQATNYMAKPIAVIYDSDGSVTDTLLGGGASDPGNCRQSAVTESVDSISANGQIQHALIILNGRCTGSAAAVQLEMKYKLVRAFGRVLGLGWSQLNDNVFTQVPQPTSQQAQNWPIMHPIDLLCGPYSYQCILQPFTLRTDDIASLVSMYPVTTAGNGKTLSYTNAAKVDGFVYFPNGQPMEGLLVSVRRSHFGPGYVDAFDLTSSVTGYSFQQVAGNAITPKGSTISASSGSTNPYLEGYYNLAWVPVPATDYFDGMTVTTSAINPLYTGQYAVGPYATSQVTPSGPAMTNTDGLVNLYFGARLDMTSTGAPATCNSAGDGTEGSPLAVASTGFWSSTLCGYQHSAWSSLQIKAGRSLTMEVTAVDEQGYATTGKMLPVLGAWDSGDPAGSLPSLASQAAALNALTLGMTNLRVSTSTARTLRLVVADQRGDGRPDYGYNARIFYADSISPASLPANGGAVTIAGMGFRPGNTVSINGIPATVLKWTSTGITLVAPAITGPLAANVVVTDLSTGAQSTMSNALTYSQTALPDVLSVVAKPADGGFVGTSGSPLFKVRVMLPDGTTPASGVALTLSSASATFGACSGAPICIVTTDASGIARSAVTPTSAGTVTLSAGVFGASITASFIALAIQPAGLSVVSMPSGTVYATLPAAIPFKVKVTLPNGTTAPAGTQVALTATNATLGGCSSASTCTMATDSFGMVSTTVTPAAAGTVSLLATAGGGTVSASFGATALPADVLRVVAKPADGLYVGLTASPAFVIQVLLGDNATPASGATVTVTASGATFTACGASTCTLTADPSGVVTTTVTPTAAGAITLSASAGGGTISTTFTAIIIPDTLQVLSAPSDNSIINEVAATPFTVQARFGVLTNGQFQSFAARIGAPAAGEAITLTAVGARLNACGLATCTLTADSAGTVSTTVTPTLLGPVTLTASAGGGTVSSTFTAAAPPDILRVLSVPANGSYAGFAASTFSVRVLLADGITPGSNISVILTSSGATLGVCGQATCVATTNAAGKVSTTVTPAIAGTILLSATAGGGTVSASFTATTPPDILHIASAPANGAYTFRPAASPFSLQVLLGDGATPASGATVSLNATGATLAACGLPSCSLTADAAGMVSTAVTPLAAGTVSLSASAGGGTASTFFTAVDPVRTISLSRSTEYVATGATVTWTPVATILENGVPAQGVNVTWTASTGLGLAASTSMTNGNGTATIAVNLGPLASGATPVGSACVWSTVCATFGAQAVDDSSWRIVAVAGDTQSVLAAGSLQPLVIRAVDDAGHWIAGVTVQVHQKVRGYVVCPRTGRCPIGPVLSTADSTVGSDSDGLANIAPLQVASTAQTTTIVAAAGANGYLSVSLTKLP